jgi:hypothetical protein
MIDQVQFGESITRFTPFGIRFWDEVTMRMIRDGLQVVAYPPSSPERRVLASVNPHGIYALSGLPGLRDIEYGLPITKKYPFVIEVTDNRNQFQPFLLSTELPWQGLFLWNCGTISSPSAGVVPRADPAGPAPTFVPLYSTPVRTVPTGQAVVRAELWDPLLQAPAAFAQIMVYYSGQLIGQSFADASGRIAVIFPYPEWRALLSSPVTPLAQPTWTIQLQAAYTPQAVVPTIPDLCSTLTQSSASLWYDVSLKTPLPAMTLVFGQDLVVQSTITGSSVPPAVLLITPAL